LEIGQEKTPVMNFKILYKRKVLEEDVPFLDHAIAGRIQSVIEKKLAMDPIRFGKPLRHELKGARSLRVGDYRIVYEVDMRSQTVTIFAIAHRRNVYE
jgi:mRNA interferase RelE/StbE